MVMGAPLEDLKNQLRGKSPWENLIYGITKSQKRIGGTLLILLVLNSQSKKLLLWRIIVHVKLSTCNSLPFVSEHHNQQHLPIYKYLSVFYLLTQNKVSILALNLVYIKIISVDQIIFHFSWQRDICHFLKSIEEGKNLPRYDISIVIKYVDIEWSISCTFKTAIIQTFWISNIYQ